MTDYNSGGRSLVPYMALEGIVQSSAPQFARPGNTTAYASGQLLANSVTAGSVVPLVFAAALDASRVWKVRNGILRKSSVGLTNPTFRLHLYTVTPVTVTNGDGGVFNTSGAADYIGAIDFAAMALAFTDGARGFGLPLSGTELYFTPPTSGSVFGLIEARAAYAPGNAETFNTSLTFAPVS